MGEAEIMTVSFPPTLTAGLSPFAMRVSALIGSPWLPVETTTTFFDFRHVYERAFGQADFAYFFSRFEHVVHTSARQRDLSAVFYGKVDYLLQTVHVGSERGDYKPAPRIFREQSVKRRADDRFAHGKARPFDIRAFAHI